MKKGFTFVELAIVLVIIGIIMGMAIKGKALIEVAKMRQEIRNIEKIEAAVAARIAQVNYVLKTLRDNGTSKINTDNLTKIGLMNESALYIAGNENNKWELHFCTATYTGATDITKTLETSATGEDICIVGVTTGSGIPSGQIVCNIEVMLDDQQARKGYGVTQSNTSGTAGEVDSVIAGTNGSAGAYDCSTVTATEVGYMYQVL